MAALFHKTQGCLSAVVRASQNFAFGSIAKIAFSCCSKVKDPIARALGILSKLATNGLNTRVQSGNLDPIKSYQARIYAKLFSVMT
jgi:hypothetical protein